MHKNEKTVDIYAKSGIMCAKGRVKYTNTHMPSLLEQMCVCTFDGRMRPRTFCALEDEAIEALSATRSEQIQEKR